jgi:hypothetical protein
MARSSELKVLSALASASKGSTGATVSSAIREFADNSIDAECKNLYHNCVTLTTSGGEDKSILVIADDGKGFISPDDAFMRDPNTCRKSFKDGTIGNFQEGLRHSTGRLEPDAIKIVSRGENGRASVCVDYKSMRVDHENGSLSNKNFEDYHKTTKESIDDSSASLVKSVSDSIKDSYGSGEGHDFFHEMVENLLDTTSDKTGTIIILIWDNIKTAPRIDLNSLYERYRAMNYTIMISSEEYPLEKIYLSNKTVDTSTCITLLGDSSVPRLVQTVWLVNNTNSYNLVIRYSMGECKDLYVGYTIENGTDCPKVTKMSSADVIARDKKPSIIIKHTCSPGKKDSPRGVMFGWKGRILGDEPTYYEGKTGKQWNPILDKTGTANTNGMGAKRTNCIASWVAHADIKDSTSFHLMFAGNLKDRPFPWYQDGNTLDSLVANFIISEVIGKIANASASQGSGYGKTGVTTHSAWEIISKNAITTIDKRCGIKGSSTKSRDVSVVKTPVVKTPVVKTPVVKTPSVNTRITNTASSSQSMTYRYETHRNSKTAYPGVTMSLPSGEKYILRAPNDIMPTGDLRKYLEGVFGNMDVKEIQKYILTEFNKESRILPRLVKSLNRR